MSDLIIERIEWIYRRKKKLLWMIDNKKQKLSQKKISSSSLIAPSFYSNQFENAYLFIFLIVCVCVWVFPAPNKGWWWWWWWKTLFPFFFWIQNFIFYSTNFFLMILFYSHMHDDEVFTVTNSANFFLFVFLLNILFNLFVNLLWKNIIQLVFQFLHNCQFNIYWIYATVRILFSHVHRIELDILFYCILCLALRKIIDLFPSEMSTVISLFFLI